MSADATFAVLVLLLGPIFASFFATLADRLPRGLAITGYSHCTHCGRRLGPGSLIPILSFLLARGRCRTCGAAIPAWLFAFELAGLVLAAEALLAVGAGWLAIVSLLFGLCLLTIAVIDARHYVVPDRLSLPLVVAGLLVAIVEPRLDPVAHLIGAAAGFLFMQAVAWTYRRLRGRDGLGGGDAKLFAAAGAWVAWQGLPLVLLIASAGGLLAVLVLALSGRRLGLGDALPFAPFLALGTWLVWLHAPPLFGG